MELRSSTHLHFVQAIKGGSVAKSMNVDTRGRPALKFKEIKEIYNLRDGRYPHQVPTICLRDDLESSPTESYVVKVESPDFSLVRGMKVKTEPEASDFNCNNDGGERNNELDDHSFGNMTLKQIKNRCKTKKRKRVNFVGLNKETVETCSPVKHELPNFQHKDDEYDLEEPLIILKSKLSKNTKSKRKPSRKSASASSPNDMFIIKSDQVNSDEGLLQPNGDWPATIDVKLENPEPGYSECRTIFSVTSVSDFSCSEQVDSTVTVSYEVPETTNVHILETEVPYLTKGPQYCSLNEVSYEYRKNFEPKFDVGVSSWEIVKVDNPEIISYEYSDLSEFKKEDYIIHPLSYDVSSGPMSPTKDYSCDIHERWESNSHKEEMPWQTSCYSSIQVPETTIASFACGLETGVSFCPIEDPICSVSNEVSYESIEDVGPKFGASFSGWEIVKVDSPEMISYQCSDLQEFGKESYTLYPLPYDVSSESTSPSKDYSPDLHDSFKSNSSEHKMARQTSKYCQIDVPEMNRDTSLQCLENINEGSPCSFESRSTHDWPSNIRNIAISPSSDNGLYWGSSCMNLERHSIPLSGDSPSAGKQSLSPDSISTNSLDASDKSMASPRPLDYHQMKQQHCPERLLSSRKAISPTSQERLCRAMELTGLNENEHHQCRGKLYFGKQTNHRILRAQGLDWFRRDGATITPKSIMGKAKQDKKVSPPKGILKVTHPSRSVQCVSGACTTVQRCSQSAIAFTQRQMRDIESLATKLTTELKSMKDIVKGKLHLELEAPVATAAKENADEVRIAIENATRAEEKARKWLAMMTKDCNRFVKIMRMTEENAAASERVILKERKITFADEAGGKLCHVKVFRDDMGTASLLESGS
ncbi:uncharacterized protein LOC111312695 [Durio zibethinus]|uniref:Uncharacterized protein LOC111312695 n=1 Tax=Durio zibethinus TaxID=66656 RepID=A0A6P6AVM3_DURZI|nr:uncharacterized protein LOC111312695 [Durio zibethinus]